MLSLVIVNSLSLIPLDLFCPCLLIGTATALLLALKAIFLKVNLPMLLVDLHSPKLALSWQAFSYLLEKLNESSPKPTWKGHRVFAVDGTRVNLPHSKDVLQSFPQQQSHFPKGLLVTAMDVFTGIVHSANLDKGFSSERKQPDDRRRSFPYSD